MKKSVLIATVLSLLMCFMPMFVHGAIQSDGNIVTLQDENTLYQKHSYARVSKQKAYGVGGLPDSEECIKLIGGDVTGHGNWYTQTRWTGSGNYVVVEFDVMLSDGTKDIFLATGGHSSITPSIAVDDMCFKDVWGNFVAIIDTKQNTSDLYFNNMPFVTGYPNVFNDGADNHTYLRIVVTGDNESVAYINNYQMYETDTKPHILPSPAIEGYEEDGVITAELDKSFDDLFSISDDATVTIYKDTTYTEVLSQNQPLKKGCVAVLKNNLGYRFYYIIVDDGVYVEDSISDGTIPVAKGESEIVYGLFGKLPEDASQKIVSATELPCFTLYTWLNDDYEGIIRADFNIEPGNAQKIYIGTNVNMPVSDALTLYSGRWNRVSVVYDTHSFDKISGKGIANIYVNGVKVSETPTIFEHLAQLRVVIEGNGGSYAYVDDFSVTQFEKTDATILLPPAISDDIEVQNGIITQKGISVGNITSNQPLDKVRVYKDAFYDEMLDLTDMPEFGNMVVIESIDNVYSYYPVFGSVTTSEVISIFQNVNAFKFANGTTSAVTSLGGKDETDTSFKVAVNSGNYCNFNYKWQNDSHMGYVVTELNVYPATASVNLWTQEFAPYSPAIDGLNPNQWNKVTAVYSTTQGQSGKCTVDLYVNGTLVKSGETTAKSGDGLMIFVSGDVGSYVYLDDFRVYQTDAMPLITTPDISSSYNQKRKIHQKPMEQSCVYF